VGFEKRKAIQKAITLIQEGRYDKAIAEYEAIIGADPSDSSLYNTLGDLYARIGSVSDAIACYQKLVGVLRSEGLRCRAIAVYKKVIKLAPDNLSALVACADLYAEEGFRAEAKHQYLLAAERSLQLGLDKQARDAYERLIRLEPGDTGVAAKLASLLASEGRQSEAADLLGRLAQEVRARGRLDDARLLCKQTVETAPEAFIGWYSLGRIDLETGRFQEAEDALLRAAKIDVTSPLPHLLLAQLYEQQMQPHAARAEWLVLLRCDPNHQEAHRRLGLLYLNEGDTEAAVGEFAAAARSLDESGELERAITLLGELGPAADHPVVQERLGELLWRSGRSTEAKAAFRRAAELHLVAGREQERQRTLSRFYALFPGDADALARLPTGAIDETRRLTLEPGERSSSETFRLSGEAEHEGLMVLNAKDESAGGASTALAVTDFYLKHGMEAEARALLRRLVASVPGNVEASRRLTALESMALTGGAAADPEIEVVQSDQLGGSDGAAIFRAFFEELELHGKSGGKGTGIPQGMAEAEQGFLDPMGEQEAGQISGDSVPGSEAPPSMQMQAHHDAAQSADRSPEICAAHYQLGIAYREMGLLDDAIAEFRRSAADEQLTLRACNMVGLCLLANGDAEAAIHELGRGLSIVGRPAEEYHGVKYDLAIAYQSIGQSNIAGAILRDVHTESPSFRDVESRLREFEGRLAQGAGLSSGPKGTIDAAKQTPSG
jgi:tetratricopeptide (TPR) repeat protein